MLPAQRNPHRPNNRWFKVISFKNSRNPIHRPKSRRSLRTNLRHQSLHSSLVILRMRREPRRRLPPNAMITTSRVPNVAKRFSRGRWPNTKIFTSLENYRWKKIETMPLCRRLYQRLANPRSQWNERMTIHRRILERSMPFWTRNRSFEISPFCARPCLIAHV